MFFRDILDNIRDIVAKNKLGFTFILIAVFLRLYRFDGFITFLGDQGRDAIIIKRMLAFEHFPAIGAPSSVGQIFLGPFYYYLMSPFLLLFNFNPLGLAFGVFLLSLTALIAAYFIIKNEVNYKTAIIFLILVTFSSVNIDLSRYSWNPNLLPIFAFFTLYFFYKFLKTNKTFFAVLFGSFLSFSIQLHYLAIFLILSLFVVFVKLLLQNKSKISYLKNIVISILTFTFFSSPLIIFDLRHNFLNLRGLLKLIKEGDVISNSSYFSRLLETNQFFLNHVLRVDLNPIIYFIFFVIVIFFSYLLIFRKKRPNMFLELAFMNFVVFIMAFSWLNSQRLPHYYGTIYYSFFLVIAYLLSYLKHTYQKYLLIPFLIIIYIALNGRYYYFLYNKPNNQIQKAMKIAESISKNVTSKTFQTVSIPYYETDGHVRYFLEIAKNKPLPADTLTQPDELFVLCFEKTCQVLGNPQWQTASFKNGKIDKIWFIEGVKIYKVTHAK